MVNRERFPKVQLLLDDPRSERIWALLLILGVFVTVVSWLDWML